MGAAIVTGAAGGMGAAIVTALSAAGHAVVGVDTAEMPAIADSLQVRGDVLSEGVQVAAFERALAASDDVFLVNSAGVTLPGAVQSDEDWRTTLDVNLTAPFQWSRRYAGHARGGRIKAGGIVFIGSLATVVGFPDNAAYQASKSGVLGLSRAYAYDLGPYGIRSNCVSPGYIATAMTRRSFEDPAMNADRRRHTLLDRWGQPEDVAGVVAFLCSPASAYVTGVNVMVDGGWSCKGLIEASP